MSEGAFAGPGRYLIDTHQVDILLHELVLFYLGNAPSPVAVVTLTETEEVEEMNAAFGLGATRAIGNAPSYVFYVASM